MTAALIQSTAYVATTGTFDAKMKEFYEKSMESLIPELFPVIDWLKEEGRIEKAKPQGKYIVFDVMTKLGSGAGYRGEGDKLPTAGPTTNVQGKIPYLRGLKGRIELSAEAFDVRNGAGAFASILETEVQGLMTAFKYLGQAAIWGHGNGILARTSADPGASVDVVLDSSETNSGVFPGTRWLYEGLSIVPVTSQTAYTADGTWRASDKIASISSDTAMKMTNTKQTTTDTCYFVEHQSAATNSDLTNGSVAPGVNYSFTGPSGLNAIADDGTFATSYCGISETTYPQWKASVSANAGTPRSLTMDLLYRLFYKMTRYSGTFTPDVVGWTNTDVYREMVDLLENQIQFKPRELKPGYRHFDVMIDGVGLPLKLDHSCPSFIYFLDPKYITMAQNGGPKIADNHGSSWRWVADYDNYEQVWRWLFQIYTNNRRKHAVLRDITRTIASV